MKHDTSVGEVRAQVISQLKYVIAELESMLETRVSETVNKLLYCGRLKRKLSDLKLHYGSFHGNGEGRSRQAFDWWGELQCQE